MTGYLYECRVRDDAIQVKRQSGPETIEISFKQTVRVPDNATKSLSPSRSR